MGQVGLSEAIEQLRWELGQAQDAGAGQQLKFEVAEVQVELLVELRKEANPEAKVSIGVVTAGTTGTVSTAHTHRLTLKLNVRDEATGGRNAIVRNDGARPWGE